MTQISLSILSSNFLELGSEIARMEPFVDRLHFDVMDGHFVQDISFGLPILKQINTALPIDAHLMVTNPLEQVEAYAEYADAVYFHIEASDNQTKEVIKKIQNKGKTAGLVLSPDSPVEMLMPYLGLVEHILIMSVHPGAGGQAYLPETLQKIRQLKKLSPAITVMVDGGMNDTTSAEARAMGIDIIVSGSYLIKAQDPQKAVDALRGL